MLDSDLLNPGRILAGVRINSKKRLLELISLSFAKKNPKLSFREIFESLCAREHLGSTSLGNGVAMPHGRISNIKTVEALFIQLIKPLPFDADDRKPVDLIFALVVPEHCTRDHTELLTSIAERFSEPEILGQLREAKEASEIWHILSSSYD